MRWDIVSIISFIFGIMSFLFFQFIGSEVLADGTLKEPFFLVPVGFLLLFVSFISFLIWWIKKQSESLI